MTRKTHGPGGYVCWPCFVHVSDHLTWKPEYRIIDTGPPDFGMDYRAKRRAPCHRCSHVIGIGDKTQKIDLEANLE